MVGASDGLFDIANAIIQIMNNILLLLILGTIGLVYMNVLNTILMI